MATKQQVIQSRRDSRLSNAHAALILCTVLAVGFACAITNGIGMTNLWHAGFILTTVGLLGSFLHIVLAEATQSIRSTSDDSSIQRLSDAMVLQREREAQALDQSDVRIDDPAAEDNLAATTHERNCSNGRQHDHPDYGW